MSPDQLRAEAELGPFDAVAALLSSTPTHRLVWLDYNAVS